MKREIVIMNIARMIEDRMETLYGDCDNVEEFVAMMTIKGVDMDYVRNWYYQRNSEYNGGY